MGSSAEKAVDIYKGMPSILLKLRNLGLAICRISLTLLLIREVGSSAVSEHASIRIIVSAWGVA
jgi:hypothetical protein